MVSSRKKPEELARLESKSFMSLLKESYKARLPRSVWLVLVMVIAVAMLILIIFAYGAFVKPLVSLDSALGLQGDFIGGHLASIISSFTLIVVILTAPLQARREGKFRVREHFIGGISAISSYEAQEAGTVKALRLLDYFSQVAIELDENELLLILNTVITGDIERRLEEIDEKKGREYPNAVEAKKRIDKLLEQHYRGGAKAKN